MHSSEGTDIQLAQPATTAQVMFRLAAALELLPHPTAIEVSSSPRECRVQVSTAADWEIWRQWLGASEVTPTDRLYQGDPIRRWESTTVWRGYRLTLVRVEFVEPAHHPDLVGETDPARVKELSDRVDADEAEQRDRLVVERFAPTQADLNQCTPDGA